MTTYTTPETTQSIFMHVTSDQAAWLASCAASLHLSVTTNSRSVTVTGPSAKVLRFNAAVRASRVCGMLLLPLPILQSTLVDDPLAAFPEGEDEGYEGPSCSICDALGHGYPGGGPCPLEERGEDCPEWAR